MRASIRLLLPVAVLLEAAPALACPLCASETGRRVREGIFGPEFGSNLFGTLLPFLILAGITAWIHRGPRSPDARPPGAGESPTPPQGTEGRPWTTS
jgi:hypothetical protein